MGFPVKDNIFFDGFLQDNSTLSDSFSSDQAFINLLDKNY